MDRLNDKEYIELLEKLIKKEEKKYGNSWAVEWGAIRNQTISIFGFWYNKHGREKAIEKIQYYLNK